MTRTITVTGGFGGSVTAELTDSLKQLAGASFLLALTPVGQDDPPAVGNAAWMSATADATAERATLSAWVDNTTPTGHYNLAVDVVAAGKHETIWAADRQGKRALVVVT